MEGLYMALPPMSPDYSGAASLFYEMGALVVIHDGTGCVGTYTFQDEPRQGVLEHMVYTTNIRENDVVMGTDESLLEKVLNAADYMDPRMIVLIGTPVPALIGTDLSALARIIEKKTSKPCFAFDTNGIGLYDRGIRMATLALCKKLADVYAPYEEEGIAIVGASLINIGPVLNAQKLKECCSYKDIKTTLIGIGEKETSIGAAARARLNIAACAAAIPACEYLKEVYGIPYFADLPIGKSGAERVCRKIEDVLEGRRHISAAREASGGKDQTPGLERIPDPAAFGVLSSGAASCGTGRKALVIHEQLTANAIRECLINEFSYTEVTVASFFELLEELKEPGDFPLADETDFSEKLEAGSFDAIFCDKLLWPQLKGIRSNLIDLPHIAVSSVWKLADHPQLFGEEFSEYLGKKIQEEGRH